MNCYYVNIKAQSCLNSNLLIRKKYMFFAGKLCKNSNLPAVVYTKGSKYH